MVGEMRVRAMATITLSSLLNFIETVVAGKVSISYARISKAQAEFEQMRADMRGLWGGLREALVNLSGEIHAEMNALDVAARNAALQIDINTIAARDFHKRLHEGAKGRRAQVLDLLWGIALTEICVYVVFFLYKWRQYTRKME
jgi:hypothetical protein